MTFINQEQAEWAVKNGYPVKSMSDAKRLIKAGGLVINGKKITDPKFKIKTGDKIQVGKRWFLKVV
jgi:predicted rRNA methylase YqxC with S4 and FtsJ domains